MFKTPVVPGVRPDPNQENQGQQRSPSSRAMSVPSVKRGITPLGTSRGSGGAGAVGEDDFRKAFDQVPKISIQTEHDLIQKMETVGATLSNTSIDWDKRVNALKTLRAIAVHGGIDTFPETFIPSLAKLSEGLIASVKDLRSQVVREACITLSYLFEQLSTSMVRVAEAVLQPLIALVQNSAKIMATSGQVASQFIIRYVHSPKLLPILLANRNSKSKELRRHLQSLLVLLFLWPTNLLEKAMAEIVETVKNGICDADPQARTLARTGYQSLETYFPNQAKFLFQSLDPSKQRSLCGVSQSSSSTSIATDRDQMPMARRPGAPGGLGAVRSQAFFNARSASAIDTKAAANAGMRKPSINALRRPAATGLPPVTSRPNGSGMAPASQPQSRSTSPSRVIHQARMVLGGRSASTVVPPSRMMNRRDGSPQRNNGHTGMAQSINGLAPKPSKEQLSALVAKVQAEFGKFDEFDNSVLASSNGAPSSTTTVSPSPSKLPGLLQGRSHSQTTIQRRSIDRVSLDGAQLNNALRMCAASQMSDRRDGLRCIVSVCEEGNPLSVPEVRKVAETLMRLLSEGNHQLAPVITDTLRVFLEKYASTLNEWPQLQLLLQRLLSKAGTEIIPTTVQHYERVLETVRERLDPQILLVALCKMLQDRVFSPPAKAKGKILEFLHKLLTREDVSFGLNSSEVRGAVAVIFQWVEDPKLAAIKPHCERVIYAFFMKNAAEFSSVLTTFPQHLRDYAHGLLKSRGTNGNGVSHGTPERTTVSGLTNQLEQMSVTPVRAAASSTVSPHTSHLPSPHRYTPLTPLTREGGQFSSTKSSTPPSRSTPQQHQQQQHNEAIEKESAVRMGSPMTGGGQGGAGVDGDVFHPMDTTSYLASDHQLQSEKLEEILAELSRENLHVARRELQKNALSSLYQMMSEGSLTLWDRYFKLLVISMFDVVQLNDDVMMKMGLKLLTKICRVQGARFNDIADMTILKVLSVMPQATPPVMQAADECARVLSTHLPTPVVTRAVVSILASQSDDRLTGALKMLLYLVESLDSDDVSGIVGEMAPGLIESFYNDSAAVRKAAVSAIVALNLKVPVEMESFIGQLPENKRKLISIYMQRAQSASTHF